MNIIKAFITNHVIGYKNQLYSILTSTYVIEYIFYKIYKKIF